MAEKPDWFKHENRTDADLSSFAESFLTLFGCKMLESSWRRCMVKEDMEMDPAVLEEFQHDWDRQAPSLQGVLAPFGRGGASRHAPGHAARVPLRRAAMALGCLWTDGWCCDAPSAPICSGKLCPGSLGPTGQSWSTCALEDLSTRPTSPFGRGAVAAERRRSLGA